MEPDDRYIRITLRIPRELHAQLSEAADRTSKSMNAEIINRLERTFADDAASTDQQAVTQRAVDGAFARLLDRLQPLLATPDELAARARLAAINELQAREEGQ